MNLNLKTVFKSASLSALALALSVGVLYAATTIGSNITTAGTLAVTGTGTFSGLVQLAPAYSIDTSSAGTLSIGTTTATTINIGGSQALTNILGNASTTIVSLTGSLMVAGNATTSPGGNISTVGNVSAATSSAGFINEIAASSASATTTLYLGAAGATKGGCIQLEGSDNLVYRMYINRSTGVATTTAAGTGLIAVWEVGACK